MKRTLIATGAASALAILGLGLGGLATASAPESGQISKSVALQRIDIVQGPYDDDDSIQRIGKIGPDNSGWPSKRPMGPIRPGYGPDAHGR